MEHENHAHFFNKILQSQSPGCYGCLDIDPNLGNLEIYAVTKRTVRNENNKLYKKGASSSAKIYAYIGHMKRLPKRIHALLKLPLQTVSLAFQSTALILFQQACNEQIYTV